MLQMRLAAKWDCFSTGRVVQRGVAGALLALLDALFVLSALYLKARPVD